MSIIASTSATTTAGLDSINSHSDESIAEGKGAGAPATPTQIKRDAQSSPPSPIHSTAAFGPASSNNGVTNANNAPVLHAPDHVNTDEMFIQLEQAQAKIQDNSLKSTQSEASTQLKKQNQIKELRQKNVEKTDKEAMEAGKQSKLGKIFGWIGRVVAVVVSAVAVAVTGVAAVVSGGAAIPLLALSVAGLVASTMSLANGISKELGGPELSLSNLISSVTVKLLEAVNVDKETAEKIGKVMVGVVAVALPVLIATEPKMLGTAAEGLCLAVGVNPDAAATVGAVLGVVSSITVGVVMAVVTTVASGGTAALSNGVKLANTIIQAAGAVVQGTMQVAKGAVDISAGMKQRNVAFLQADGKDLQTLTMTLKQEMKKQQDALSTLMDHIQSNMTQLSSFIKELYDSLSQISNNIGRTQSA